MSIYTFDDAHLAILAGRRDIPLFDERKLFNMGYGYTREILERGALIAVTVNDGVPMYPAFQFGEDRYLLPFVQIINRLLNAEKYPASALKWWYDEELGLVLAEKVRYPEDHKHFGNTFWMNVILQHFSD